MRAATLSRHCVCDYACCKSLCVTFLLANKKSQLMIIMSVIHDLVRADSVRPRQCSGAGCLPQSCWWTFEVQLAFLTAVSMENRGTDQPNDACGGWRMVPSRSMTLSLTHGHACCAQDIEAEIWRESKEWLLDGGSLPADVAAAAGWDVRKDVLLGKETALAEHSAKACAPCCWRDDLLHGCSGL